MAAASVWTLTNEGRTKLLDGTIIPGADTFKMALFQSTSNIGAASALYSSLTNELANANGYLTGGVAVTLSLSGTTVVMIDSTDGIWTAAGGPLDARFAVIYEVGGHVLAYSLLDTTPADLHAADGQQLKVEIAAQGLGTLT